MTGAELAVDGFVSGGGTRTQSVRAGELSGRVGMVAGSGFGWKATFHDDLMVLRALAGSPFASHDGDA